jgi:putative ABC transport system permease protein
MLLNLAWKNIWRNKTRSLVLITAVALGIWGGLSMISFSLGMNDQRAKDQIQNQISHLQLHHPEFREERKIQFTIPGGDEVLEKVRAEAEVVASTSRSLAMGMLASPRKTVGIMVSGVDPENEALVTKLAEKVTEGDYFPDTRSKPILVSERTRDMLKLKLRSKLTITTQNADGDMVAEAFRVAGFYQTIDTKYDESHVFVKQEHLQSMLGQPGEIHEIALLVEDKNQVDSLKASLTSQLPEVLVEDWKDVSPELRMMVESMDQVIWIFVGIIVIGLFFGIINTMLMAVLERSRETGMLMAIGMNKRKVFSLIILESILLSLVGVPVGLLATEATVGIMSTYGLDLSSFSEGLAQFGMSARIFPVMDRSYYLIVSINILLAAFIASIYPGFKSLGMQGSTPRFFLVLIVSIFLTPIAGLLLTYFLIRRAKFTSTAENLAR